MPGLLRLSGHSSWVVLRCRVYRLFDSDDHKFHSRHKRRRAFFGSSGKIYFDARPKARWQ